MSDSKDRERSEVETVYAYEISNIQAVYEFSMGTDLEYGFFASYRIVHGQEEVLGASMRVPRFKVCSTSIQLQAGFLSLVFLKDSTPSMRVKFYELFCFTLVSAGTGKWDRVGSFTDWDISRKARLKHHFEKGKTYFFSLQVIFENDVVSTLSEPQQISFYPSGSMVADETGNVYYTILR